LQQVKDDDRTKRYRDGRCNNTIDLDPGTSGEAPLRDLTTEPAPPALFAVICTCHDVYRLFASFLFSLYHLTHVYTGPSESFNVTITPPLPLDIACPKHLSPHTLCLLQHNDQSPSETTSTASHNPRKRHHRSLPQRHRPWRPKDQQDFFGSTIETLADWSRDKMPGNPLEESESQDRTPYTGRKDRGLSHGRRQSCRFESREGKEEKG
jgi:hypothetical protein